MQCRSTCTYLFFFRLNLSLGALPQLLGALPQLLGALPQLLGALPQLLGVQPRHASLIMPAVLEHLLLGALVQPHANKLVSSPSGKATGLGVTRLAILGCAI